MIRSSIYRLLGIACLIIASSMGAQAQLFYGTISNKTQTIPAGTTPAQINASAATGGACPTAYQWQLSLNGTSFTDISGANSQNYQPPVTNVTTYFRRWVDCTHTLGGYTDTALVTVTAQPLNGGCITSGDQTISYGSIPADVTAIASSAGSCSGIYGYRWQYSTDNVYFKDMPFQTGQNLVSPSPVTQNTWYQRKTICGSEIAYTRSIKVTVTGGP